jgi:tRNA G18 (ribose-2'-O)-methylase SpoU
MVQTHYTTRNAARLMPREDYPKSPRNNVAIVSWSTKTPNIGSIQRLAEVFKVEDLYALRHPAAATAVSAGKWQPTTITWQLRDVVEFYREVGYTVVALEQTNESVRMETAVMPERMCLLVGNEGSGVPQSVLDLADMAVEITQYGVVGSLNVATATAVALYEWSRQHLMSHAVA